MRLHRRELLSLMAAVAAGPFASRVSGAQSYPARPVRLLVGFPPGGPADIFSRLIAQWLSARLGQPFVVENRAGAGGHIATESAVHAVPDGYTLVQVGPPSAIDATLYEKLSYDFRRDIVPVASIVRSANVLVVNPAVPAMSVPEFVAYAKSRSGTINMASSGNGTVTHVAGELFKMMAGINMLHVPYRGSGPALADLIGGQVQVMFDNLPSSIEFIRAGRLRALAVTTLTRSQELPDIPAMAEFMPGYEASSWFGIGAPRNTPADIVTTLNGTVNEGLADPTLKARIAKLGGVPLPDSPANFDKLIGDETEKWAKVIKFAGIKPT